VKERLEATGDFWLSRTLDLRAKITNKKRSSLKTQIIMFFKSKIWLTLKIENIFTFSEPKLI
tara:strand:+ start:450 stop:635 length:186 start_codon:yes stop_codon:yes gene_type:complete